MEAYSVFRDLAIIIVAAKIFAILARKCKAPQVVGEIVAGLILGPSVQVRWKVGFFCVQLYPADGGNRRYSADVFRRSGNQSA